MNVFSIRLKELREEMGLSISQLAKNIGYSDVAVGRWERGLRQPNIEALIALAKYFKVSTDYLCGLED